MLEGLTWLGASVLSFIAVMHYVPKSFVSAVAAYKKRNVEPPTTTPPSAACPIDGGTWGSWSKVREEQHPNDPRYPLTQGTHTILSQSRVCSECGYAERRVL